jgi:endogenous inhibitor of DNA gyrase (YacG/DUF329 family)
MTQQRSCLTCGTTFEVPATSTRKFCSIACRPTQTHSRKPKALVTVECARCGNEFQRKAWEVEQRKRKGWALYCSVECRDAVKRGRQGERRVERVQLRCENCGGLFEVAPHESKGRKFCSKTCAVTAPGRGRKPQDTRTINSHGYAFVFVPIDERPPGQRHIARHPEHRVVMARELGRWPTAFESVHHRNGDRLDNRPENLQLRSGSHGKGVALRCRCCGSSDIETVELN